MSALGERVRRLRLVPDPVPSWQVPPPPGIARPDLTVAVVASDRLRTGLADQWRQRPVAPDAIRLVPPLTIARDELDLFVAALPALITTATATATATAKESAP